MGSFINQKVGRSILSSSTSCAKILWQDSEHELPVMQSLEYVCKWYIFKKCLGVDKSTI